MFRAIIKKVAFSVVSLVLAYNTFKLIAILIQVSPSDFSMVGVIIAAMVITVMTTGVFAFLGFVYPTHKLIPNAYYKVTKPELLNRVYRMLGVAYFKRILLITFYRKKDNKKYFNGTKSGVLLFNYHTKQSEFGHLIAFILLLFVSLFILYSGHRTLSIWICILNIVFNFYPVILQRKHRLQIDRILKKDANHIK